ncbi:MAG: phage tail protein [Anaerotignum propionicum]|uniref:phage tail sheath family protein n=1 Tax=Anaerotignum propionicum TaxID=28446 RepID=UPI002B20086D|nr:phage tail protein [Anaerotignum propionicum]MEA5057772.1 phage tail protein [Anaerotignum propionicum]
MAFYHGVSTRQADTSVSTPVTADSGIAFIVGAAPVHTVGGKVNEPIMCMNYGEAVSALGYSDDWEKYPLCEAIYSQFKLYGVAPVVFVNVLDPTKHKEDVTESNYQITDKKVLLPLETLKNTVKVKKGVSEFYVEGTDYDTFYEGENLILEVLETGSITASTGELTISYTKVNPAAITKAEIIGGFDTNTKKYSGFELIDSVFPKFGIVADLLLAPGWSHESEVAAIMSAKAAAINGVFEGKALIDIDAATVTHYADVPAWKKSNNINAKTQVLCYPLVKLGDRVFHLSVQAAGRMAKTDADNGGCPAESPSNELLQIDSAVLADGSEVLLDLQQANYLNSNGVVTAMNFIGGYVLWGNQTACFPADTDVKNYFICVSRMFGWVANSLILTYWSKVDKKMTRRLIDSIVDSVNIWLNGLVAEEKLLGGRVEFREEENTTVALMAGKAVFHIYMTPPSPAQELNFVLEYDVNYVADALTA